MYANEYISLLRREKFQASQAHFTFLLGSKTLGILGWMKFMTIKHLVVSKFYYHHCQFFHVWGRAVNVIEFLSSLFICVIEFLHYLFDNASFIC